MTRISDAAAKAWGKARKASRRPQWMVKSDITPAQWAEIEAQLSADIGAAMECAKTAKELNRG